MSNHKSTLLLITLLAAALASVACASSKSASNDEVVVLDTNYGQIVIQFYRQEAPRHTANFKELAKQGFFDGTKFHQIIRYQGNTLGVLGGDPTTKRASMSEWGKDYPEQSTVAAEYNPKLKHVRGIITAATRPGEPDTHTSQFVICVAEAPMLDEQKLSIFARVLEGMNVVDSIVRAPTWPKTQTPRDPVVVNKAYVTKLDALDAGAK
ncbi:MAG TPA: peptidylprolyl isomerase [Blastocatellia bacterium]|nr:peptidylprolyl isomerase [Blastocatellia bacterium]